MNKSQILALYTQDQRIDVTYPDTRREVTPTVVRHIDTSGDGEGTVLYSQLTEANAEASICEQIAYFESIEQNFEWKVYDYDMPPDLKDRLSAVGFVVEEADAIMVLDLDNASNTVWQPIHHDIRQIIEPEKLMDVQTVEEQVWDEDTSWVVDYLGSTLRNYPAQMNVYVAYVDEQPASAAWAYFPSG